jgi:hypothetical protein
MEPIKSPNMVVISPKDELIKQDWQALAKRGILFLTPLVALYLTPIIATITEAVLNKTFVFALSLFIPSQLVIGGMILYILNQIWDGVNRFMKETTYISELK